MMRGIMAIECTIRCDWLDNETLLNNLNKNCDTNSNELSFSLKRRLEGYKSESDLTLLFAIMANVTAVSTTLINGLFRILGARKSRNKYMKLTSGDVSIELSEGFSQDELERALKMLSKLKTLEIELIED